MLTGLSPLLISCKNHLGIAGCPELRAQLCQFVAELKEVINLAIEYNAIPPTMRAHRLIAGREIKDRQAPKCQTRATINVNTLAVRTTMSQQARHSM